MIKNVIQAAFAAGLLACVAVEACTGIKLAAKDGSVINGRTLEFGIVIDTSVVVVPRGYEFYGTTPKGRGLAYKAKYAAAGAIAFDNVAILDGINEKGLSVGTFYFPGYASYTPITSQNQSKAMSPTEFANWVVTQFATIDEVKDALSTVVIAPTVVKEWGPEAAPFHYVVYDKSGKSLVIEPIDGKLVAHENPLGVITNSPDFVWHLTNLRNYINLTPFNTQPIQLDGLDLTPFGQGSGMVGLPGDFTPPSRFVQAAVFSTTAKPSDNADQSVYQAFHILNQFDIPVGVTSAKGNDGVVHSDFTQMTCVKDPQSLKYYFKTYDDQSIRVVDLKKFNLNDKAVKRLRTSGADRSIDVSSGLK